MKLKVKAIFFDRVEDRYVYPEREPVIERDTARAKLNDAPFLEPCSTN